MNFAAILTLNRDVYVAYTLVQTDGKESQSSRITNASFIIAFQTTHESNLDESQP